MTTDYRAALTNMTTTDYPAMTSPANDGIAMLDGRGELVMLVCWYEGCISEAMVKVGLLSRRVGPLQPH